MVGPLERRGVRHGFALACTIAVVLAVVVVATFIAALSVGELVVQIPKYESRLNAALAELRGQLTQLGIRADPGAVSAIVSPACPCSVSRGLFGTPGEPRGAQRHAGLDASRRRTRR